MQRIRIVVVTAIVVTFAPLARSESTTKRGADDLSGVQQILVIREFGREQDVSEVVLYENGVELVHRAGDAGPGLGWSWIELDPKRQAEIKAILKSKELAALSKRYEVAGVLGEIVICGVPSKGRPPVEVVLRGNGSRVPEPKKEERTEGAPDILSRLLIALRQTTALRGAAHWQPEWIDIGLQHESPDFLAPPRDIPPDWLIDAVRPGPNVLRVSGRFERALHAFCVEREQARAPAMLNGEACRISANAVLPGREACPERTVNIGAAPAERGVGSTPPAR